MDAPPSQDRPDLASALQQSEERFRLAATSTSDIIYEWDVQSGALQWFGPVERLLGCRAGEVPRSLEALTRLIHPEDLARVTRDTREGLRTGQPWRGQYRVLCHDGTVAHWMGTGIGRSGADGQIRSAIGAITDVTERVRAEEALHETEHRLRLLSDNLQAGLVYQLDSGEDGALRRFTYVSAGVERLHGVTVAQALANPECIYAQVVEADRDLVARREAEALAAMAPMVAELRLRLPSGEERWRLFSSAPRRMPNRHVLWDGIEIDITEQKRAVEALRASEEKYRALFEQSADGVYLHDLEGRLLDVNQVACAQSGYTRDELLGLTIFDLHQDTALRDAIIAQWREWPVGQRVTLEANHRRKDGTLAPVEISTGVLMHDDRRLLLAIARDIGARKQAELERARLHEQLLQAQKMETIGRLAGGVAHDFNNMLLAILGHADMALEQLDPGCAAAADLAEIRKAAERSAELTRQLLAFARKQTIAPRNLDLNQTVSDSLRMLRRLLGEQVALRWLPGAPVWPVRMDPGQVEQILTNLCLNARDAIAGAGTITIETGNRRVDEAYCAQQSDAMPGEYAVLSVSDTGCGMDRDTVARLFEPFFTTKELGRGTGLGLSTVHGIVKQNRGHVSVYSEPGRGSTFAIYLPRTEAPAATLAAAASPAPRPREPGHATVLVVEDEPAILRVATRVLEREGYHVLAAATPGHALQVAHAHAGHLDLLLTDVVMPEQNGRELARQLMALHPGLRCLFMSGYTADVIADHGVLDEGVHFLQKPFSRDELLGRVRQVLNG